MGAEVHCKGCGEPMTEGRAYELGNHRWHVKCFRCSNCHDQLTAHTNMLVLGDGTLVCANCSYTCAVCSKKIMDMAVLTNDQAFCASCFVCRNCKKRIDDLQYARTSQGIFCMTCHSALLARKRQRQLQKQQGARKEVAASDKAEKTQPSSQSKTQRPPTRPPTHRGESGENVTTLRSPSNSGSSRSSILSTPSYNRNKDLPELPSGTPSSLGGSSIGTPLLSAASAGAGSASEVDPTSSQTSLKEPKQLRVPRKQLAPSAFQNYENDDASNTSLGAIQRMVSAQSDKDAESSYGDVNTNGSTITDASSVNGNNSANLSVDSNLTARDDSSKTIDRKPVPSPTEASESDSRGTSTEDPPNTPKASQPGRDTINVLGHYDSGSVEKLPEPLSMDTPPRSVIRDEFPTPDTVNNADASQVLTPDATLNIPQRSQLRPVSPAKSWRSSPANSEYSPRGVRSPAAFATAPLERQTSSPTQAAAPQQAPRSPFSRWWHKRDNSAASTGSAGSSYVPVSVPVQAHKRSASESNTGETDPTGLRRDSLSEALNLLSLERERASAAEQKLLQFQRRDDLEADLANLERQVSKMREEHKLLTSRNKQLSEMNAELQRQTIEKFGPNTLWGSQNPPPNAQEHIAPSQTGNAPGTGAFAGVLNAGTHSRDLRDAKENPLVTRLDEPSASLGSSSSTNGGSGALQAQFLPFKTAKQWLFRRPNRPERDRAQPNTNFAYNQYNQAGPMYTNGNDSNPTVNQKAYNGESGINGTGVTVLNGGGSGYPVPKYAAPRPPERPAADSLLGDKLSYRVQVDQAPVPFFVTRCFSEVEQRGLDTEGVYRKPGSKSQVDAILEQFGPNGDVAVGEKLLGGEIPAITSAVKQYLRRLADPVITYDCYDAFIAAGNSKNVEVLRKCIRALPAEHSATLRAVAFHLALVASHEATNLMNTRNLAMVFAPTIAREESGEREIPDMQARNEATHMIIVNVESLFDPIDELL